MTRRTQTRKKFTSNQIVFSRFMIIVVFFMIWMLGIGVRLVHLQVNQRAWLKEKANGQRQDIKKSKLLRGTIYDRDDHILATSIRVKTLYADPTEIDDIDNTVKSLVKTLKIDGVALAKQLTEGKAAKRRFVPVLKKQDDGAVQRLNKALETDHLKKADLPQFDGLHWAEDQIRQYPYETLAAQVIGFSNADDIGVAGIEQSQELILHGAVTKKVQARDRLGRVYGETLDDREQPGDIALTIGTSYQFMADEALSNGVKAAQAKAGMAIVMSVKTGEILAMSNYPTFNPNAVKTIAAESITNRTIQSTFTPGSTFKLVTYSSGLEKKLFRPDDRIDAGNGTIEIGKHKFSDSHHVGTVSYSQALAHSSNVCAIKTGQLVGKDDFWAMLQNLGFGSRTGIELPAETSGIVRVPEKWNGDSLASMSIGYEIGVTALQMATAFATIANDGVKIQPRIIKEIRKPEEKPVPSKRAENVRVVSVETARNLRTMLRQVVLTGTGRRAQLNGYTSAGKTGTAWKFDPKTKRIDQNKYVSSFIGIAPADNPEVVIAVVIDEPKGGARDGGKVAAPVFKAIAEQILPALNVKPDGAPIKQLPVAKDIPETTASADDKTPEKKIGKGDKNEEKKAAANGLKESQQPKRTKEVKKQNEKRLGERKEAPVNTPAFGGIRSRPPLVSWGET